MLPVNNDSRVDQLLGSFPIPYWSLCFVDSTAVKKAFPEADVSF